MHSTINLINQSFHPYLIILGPLFLDPDLALEPLDLDYDRPGDLEGAYDY